MSRPRHRWLRGRGSSTGGAATPRGGHPEQGQSGVDQVEQHEDRGWAIASHRVTPIGVRGEHRHSAGRGWRSSGSSRRGARPLQSPVVRPASRSERRRSGYAAALSTSPGPRPRSGARSGLADRMSTRHRRPVSRPAYSDCLAGSARTKWLNYCRDWSPAARASSIVIQQPGSP